MELFSQSTTSGLVGFSDANFAGDQDRHSVGGYMNVMIKIDNRPALHLINNPGYYVRLKHVDICHKFVMEANKYKVVQVDWCSTDQMYADALTKPLGGPQLDLFRKNVMGNHFLAHLDR